MLLGFEMDYVESVENFAMNILTVLYQIMNIQSISIIFFNFFHLCFKTVTLKASLPPWINLSLCISFYGILVAVRNRIVLFFSYLFWTRTPCIVQTVFEVAVHPRLSWSQSCSFFSLLSLQHSVWQDCFIFWIVYW